MTKEQAEYFYGSIKAFYGTALVGSIIYGVIDYIFQTSIYGDDGIFEKAVRSCIYAAFIFLLSTFDVTWDIIKKEYERKNEGSLDPRDQKAC